MKTGFDLLRVRIAVGLPVTAVALWLSVAITFCMTSSSERPELALILWPYGAAPKAVLAAQILAGDRSKERLAQAEGWAIGALNREPVNASAAATLGTIAGLNGDDKRADRLFRFAERLSRRNLLTELWLIERSIGRQDVDQALVHYDRALKTNASAFDLLLPTLARASDDRAIRKALIPMLRQHPPWWTVYLPRLAAENADPQSLVQQTIAMHPDITVPGERNLLQGAVSALVAKHEYAKARTLLRATVPGMAIATTAPRNGGFEVSSDFLPFDWWLRDEADLTASVERNDRAGSQVLHIVASAERGGEVARQLILLPPGKVKLFGITGNMRQAGNGGLQISLTCEGGGQVLGRSLATNPGDAPRRFEVAYLIPPRGCSAQWLSIAAPPAEDIDMWIDDLRFN